MELYERYGLQLLSEKIKQGGFVKKIAYYHCTDSTNVRAKAAAEGGALEGTLIVADQQTAGRGRRGREWDSPMGKNIYFSLLLRPECSPEKASMLTLVMALAVARGIEHCVKGIGEQSCEENAEGYSVGIKWPNDIVLNGKKVCGILTEMSLRQNAPYYVVIGVGINVYEQRFADSLADKATALETELGKKLSRSELIANIMEAFEEYYAVFTETQSLSRLREMYNALLVNRNRSVCVLDPGGEWRGTATGITDTGELCVVLADGSVTTVYAGEVSVRGIYGYV